MKKLIVGDVHGREKKWFTVLYRAGAIDLQGNKTGDVEIIQLGDFLSLGYDEQEAEFYEKYFPYIDVALWGNHELPAIWYDESMHFLGWDADTWHGWKIGRDREAERMVRANFREGKYKAATAVGKWIITHAGIIAGFQNEHGYLDMTPEGVVDDLEARFVKCLETRKSDPIISSYHTGIFWVRPSELTYNYSDKHHHQIFGHTPASGAPKLLRDNLYLIDSPPIHHRIHGGVVGLLTEDDGETFELIYVE